MKKFLTILSVIALACACTKNEESDPVVCPVVGDQQLTITASTEGNTRISAEDNAAGGIDFKFKVGDKIGVYLFKDVYGKKLIDNAKNLCFVVKSVDESGKATFAKDENTQILATDLTAARKIYAYYPYDKNQAGKIQNSYYQLAAVVPEEQIQASKDDFSHLYDTYTMVTKITNLTKKDDNVSVDLKFSGAFSIVKLHVKNQNAADDITVKSVKMTVPYFGGGSSYITGSFLIDSSTDPAFSQINSQPASGTKIAANTTYKDAISIYAATKNSDLTVSLTEPATIKAGESADLYAITYSNSYNAASVGIYPFKNPTFVVTDNNNEEIANIDFKSLVNSKLLDDENFYFFLPRNQITTFSVVVGGNDGVAKVGTKAYATLEAAIAAAKTSTSKTVTLLKGNTYSIPQEGKDITGISFAGEDTSATIDITNIPTRYSDITFKNLTISARREGSGAYCGFQHSGTLTFTDCIIKGFMTGYGTAENYTNCTFSQDEEAGAQYNMCTYGATAQTFTNCTFNSKGKFINVYADQGETHNIMLNNCTFNSSATNKCALNIKTVGPVQYSNVKINNCKLTGSFPSTNNGLWVVGDENGSQNMETKTVKVFVDGVSVFNNNAETITDGSELKAALASEAIITVNSDISGRAYMTDGKINAPIVSTLVLENNAKITHSVANGSSNFTPGLYTTFNIKGEGTIEAFPIAKSDTRNIALDSSTTIVNIEGKVNFEGGSGSKTNNCVYIHVGTVNIYGGNFHTGLDVNGKANACVLVDAAPSGQAYLNIYDGYFENEAEADGTVFPVINIQDDAVANSHVVIYGGKFVGFNPADGDNSGKSGSFVATGYQSVKQNEQINGKDVWVVSKK